MLTSTTAPDTGEYSSETDLTDSISPNASPATTSSPTAGRSTYTTSPSWSWAKSVMPIDATSPSVLSHSCSLSYLRSVGYMGRIRSFHALASQGRYDVLWERARSVSYTHLRAHETRHDLVCRLLLEK